MERGDVTWHELSIHREPGEGDYSQSAVVYAVTRDPVTNAVDVANAMAEAWHVRTVILAMVTLVEKVLSFRVDVIDDEVELSWVIALTEAGEKLYFDDDPNLLARVLLGLAAAPERPAESVAAPPAVA